jgi:hypothetical protein
LCPLAQALRAVAIHLYKKAAAGNAAHAAAHLTRAMSKTSSPSGLSALAKELALLSDRLEEKQRILHCAGAAEALSRAMTRESNTPNELHSLAEALAVVAGRLEDKEAARHCARAASVLARVMRISADRPGSPLHARGLAVLAGRLELADLARAAEAVTQAMSMTPDAKTRAELAEQLEAVLTGDTRDLPSRAAGMVADAGALQPGQALETPYRPAPARKPRPCRLSTEELVELLRSPFCVGHARRVVLQQLARRFSREFADQWDFVRFARARNLGLDFTARPRRQEAQSPQIRK